MCGIAGISWCDEALVTRMTAVLRHRGPDQSGIYTDEAASLGHRRLSIIDLSQRGRQPLSNEDETVWVCYNGEIYNFREMRDELAAAGHRFRSRTDSEVIVHAYEQWGVRCVERFNGIFAFAIWDRNRQQLVLVRDRLGVKPLYYATVRRPDGDQLVFASEMKAVLQCADVDRRVDAQSLYHYMGYEYAPAPNTIVPQIKKLEPAHLLIWQTGRPAQIQRYWRVPLDPVSRSRAEHAQAMRAQLQHSVQQQLISDVPLGVFLSGGLDSTALVAMMSRCGVEPIKTFSLYYADKSFGEIEYARMVAKRFKTEHHEILIDPISPDLIEQMVWHMDEPMSELSAFPFYILCKKARQHVTVCLSGEGGDETLVGYDRFKASKAHVAFAILPLWLRRNIIGRLLAGLRDRPRKKGAINVLKRFVEGGLLPADGEHMRWQYFSSPQVEANLFSKEARSQISFDPFAPIRRVLEDASIEKRLDREIYLDLCFMMPDAVCSKVDKMSMAHAMEVRVPFLDHQFVELCGSVPGSMKLKGMQTKAIFREAMSGIIPDEILYRGKQGYSLPVKNWLRKELRDYMVDTIEASPVVREWFNMDYLRQIMTEHAQLRANHSHLLWGLLNLAVWHRLFLDA